MFPKLVINLNKLSRLALIWILFISTYIGCEDPQREGMKLTTLSYDMQVPTSSTDFMLIEEETDQDLEDDSNLEFYPDLGTDSHQDHSVDLGIRDLGLSDIDDEGRGDEGIDPHSEPAPLEGVDNDEDGLSDYWEWSLGDRSRFDWTKADSDEDGIPDADEDEDEDGISAYQEQRLSFWLAEYEPERSVFSGGEPSPFKRDLLVQIDEISGTVFDPLALNTVLDSFAALSDLDDSLDLPEGLISHGVTVHIFVDETLNDRVLDGDFEGRFDLLNEGARMDAIYADLNEYIPESKFIHVVSASERLDDPSRAGEAVNHPSLLSSSGIIIYLDTISAQHPSCGLSTPPPVPFIEIHEAQAGTLVHELGHALQLGHDTELNGGVNPYNVMAVVTGCVSARQRYHGEGNLDPVLGASEQASTPRFSQQAAELMRFTSKLSVDVSTLENAGRGFDH